MREEKMTCRSCLYEDDRNPLMCETCNKRVYSHWKPNKQAEKSMKSCNKTYYKYKRKPVKNEFYKYWEKSGLTQRRLAVRLGITQRCVEYRCSGMPIQSLKFALEISKKTNVPLIDLVCTAEWRKNNNITRKEIIEGFEKNEVIE